MWVVTSGVGDSSADPARVVVAAINGSHEMGLTLGRRCAGGEQGGAWVVTDSGGTDFILKWEYGADVAARSRAAAAVNRIAATGYPTPRWILVGGTDDGICYYLQEFVPGTPARLTAETATLVVGVIEQQAGRAPDLDRDWSAFVTGQALDDNDPESGRRFVRDLGEPGQALVAHYDAVLAPYGPIGLPRSDLVHGDFSTGNVLIHDGRISGLVDIQALGHGTRVIDYAWLVREVFGTGADQAAADILRRAADRAAGPGPLALCTTATALDMVRWIGTHGPEHLPILIDRMHGLADYLSRPIAP